MRILAIDPGTRIIGFCILEGDERAQEFIDGGALKVKKETLSKGLVKLFGEVLKLILKYSPQLLVVESPFYGKNVKTLIRLGEAKGVITLAATLMGINVKEITPAEVKMALTGHGNAKKDQVAYMVRQILDTPPDLSFDATDAAAIGITYLQRKFCLSKSHSFQ